MPFKKGQSGNPAGRRAKTSGEKEVEALARRHAPSAIGRLKFWMDSDNPKASVSAANALLDRGYGRPKQQNEHSGPDGGAIPHAITWKQPE
jgi:hypothetical protein